MTPWHVGAGLGVVFAGALMAAWRAKPRLVWVEFPVAPGFARINTPKEGWPEERRTVRLPDGQRYTIPAEERGHFILLANWEVRCRFGKELTTFTVPRSTTTDFASIPRPFQSLITPLSNTVYAAVFHDYLYRNPGDEGAWGVTREEADRAFYWGMRACGVKALTAGVMYWGVRLFGAKNYVR